MSIYNNAALYFIIYKAFAFPSPYSSSSSTKKKFNVSAKPPKTVLKGIKDLLAANGKKITRGTALALAMTDSPVSCVAKAWMTSFFELVGDKEPNRDEIHLDSFHTIHSIYDEYVGSVNELFTEVEKSFLSFTAFNNLWKLAFPYVKLRVYKQVLPIIMLYVFKVILMSSMIRSSTH